MTRTLILVAAGLMVLGCRLAGASAVELPPDVQNVGSFRMATADESDVAISADEAVQAARSDGYDWPNPGTYLVVGTVSGQLNPVASGVLWLVRWDDIYFNKPAPSQILEPLITRRPYTHAYVFVDATTGAVVSTTLTD